MLTIFTRAHVHLAQAAHAVPSKPLAAMEMPVSIAATACPKASVKSSHCIPQRHEGDWEQPMAGHQFIWVKAAKQPRVRLLLKVGNQDSHQHIGANELQPHHPIRAPI